VESIDMTLDPTPVVLSAFELIRRGRFLETVTVLKQISDGLDSPKSVPTEALVLLADALQRVGQNDKAELIASKGVSKGMQSPSISARFHLVLGNVLRERGKIAKAVEHFQIAVSACTDHEVACWAQLRLMRTIAELNGPEAAMARLDQVKRTLTRFGDARPFAALHLWFVQIDAMRGDLSSARRHLYTADSLLTGVDDLWLKGYLAINSSVVHYYGAEIGDARRWAESAIACGTQSGHRTTKRAAHTNLGYFEFAVGRFSRAEEYFQAALECCEPGSLNEIAILDNIAETKLQRGDLEACKVLLSKLDNLSARTSDANRQVCMPWIAQTTVRLMLREGRGTEARKLSETIRPTSTGESPESRTTTESVLLTTEALLETEPMAAARNLSPVIGTSTQLSPDLFAETELVTGRLLEASGAPDLARVHIERAVQTYGAIGHIVGQQRSLERMACLPPSSPKLSADVLVERSLDRFRALLDLRSRAELFGCEAVSVLHDLNCSAKLKLTLGGASEQRVIRSFSTSDVAGESSDEIAIEFGDEKGQRVALSFLPLSDPKSQLTALTFKRIVEQILLVESKNTSRDDPEVVWTTNDISSVKQGIVFASEAMFGVWRTVKQIAPTDVSVLVTGETGTGKEVIAKTIHEYSRRSAMPFLALNCAAVPKDLLESQLFGHRKGAFSGAAESHQGIVRAASGGTLFLDEIGELPMDMQAKLLRFLEMSEVHPVGESHPVKVNVRLVFATNGDLEEAVSQNRFRQDLFYRLNVIPIKVPPLRERREEIPVLAHLFAQRFATEFAKDPVRFASSAMELLIMYAWPGNIRQLANEVRRLTALSESGACITADQLSPQFQAQKPRTSSDTGESASHLQIAMDQSLAQATDALESEMIKHALRQAGGRMSSAAATLGISRKGLYLKRQRLGLLDFSDTAHLSPVRA
jgi:DNA-binding NtrC family response regulator/tetratricopeptide (TPR) repeat protein